MPNAKAMLLYATQKTSPGVFELLDSFVMMARRASVAMERHAAQRCVRADLFHD
ncbi:hypothetical protein NKJ59_31350 [Mesorhizobium australicum]|uniref:hypothetical protein n=1 Tax=Mesorhizobium australicum TaxID=536018 RepID=UPI00333ADBD2